jgi:hypothetical protein
VRALAAALAATLACGGAEGGSEPAEGAPDLVEVPYREPFVLGLGEGALVAGALRVTFQRVAEESRCPQGARCVEAGSAAAAFAVEGDAGRATLTLNAGREPRSATAAGHELRLDALEPHPRDGVAIDTAAYRATLVVAPAP